MSSISSFSGTTGSVTNFTVSAANQSTMTDLKTYVCPKCNKTYDLNLRSSTYVGRVPLILKCNHTMCEECIRISFSKREVVCAECQQPSVVVENEKRKIQEVFPVNFYLMGVIYYSKPNMNEISKLNLRPAGVSYRNKDKQILESHNSSLCSEPGDVWSKSATQSMMQEKCSQEGCNKSAVLRCADCVEVYCQCCCQTLHKAARGLQTHKITALSGDFALELTEKCPLHKENILEFQCNTCEKMVCAYCVIQSHQNHSFCQLTYLNESDRPNFETLIQNAEEKLKRLMLAHKKIKWELEQAQTNKQTSSLESTVANYFANLHGRLQILEKRLRADAKNAKNTNSITLNEVSNELLSNIRTLYRLINTAKNIDTIHTTTTKFNVNTIIERLENSLALPCYLVGQQQSMENIGFVCSDVFNNFEENFAINIESASADSYQLVTEDELPEGYDRELPSELSLIDISDCSLASAKSESYLLSILKSQKDLTPRELLTNALQPKTSESSSSTSIVEDWVQNVTEEARFISNLPLLKSADREYVTVTHIDNPECFYVQLIRFNNKLQSLSKEIHQYVRNFAPVLKSIELNKLYIVKYETKDARPEWYRARVIDIILNKNEEKVYNVLFIDYGNTRVVNIHMLRKINRELAKPRPFALQCKLFNVYPVHRDWDANAVRLMAQILTGVDVLMVVMNNSEGNLEVDLVTLCSGHMSSTRDALIFVGHAVPSVNTSSPINYPKMKSEKPMPKLHTRTENFKKEQTLEVILSHVVDPYNIYIQVADYVHHIEHVSDVMARHYNKPGKAQIYGTAKGENIYVPKKDMVVAARCSDIGSLWYRGIVKKTIDGQGMVEVFLVDYGKTAIISYTDIRRLTERFRNLDCQALLMKMADIKPQDGQKVWKQNATEFLMKYVAKKEKLRLIVVEAEKPPKVALFECYASMDICINALMVREKLANPTGKMSENVEWIKDNTNSVKQEPSYVLDLMNTIQCSKNTYVDDSESDQENANKIRKQVRVLLTQSPDVIYVACDDEKSKNDQHKLHRSLQDYYSKHHRQTADWKVGDPCVVYNRPKRLYFRAVILEKIDDINFKVILRDIAEEIMVSKGNISILDNQFKKYREGTFRCHLTGVAPAGDSSKWSGLAVEFLQDVFTKNNAIFMTKDGPVDKNRKSFPVIMWYAEFKPGEALEPSRFIDHNINKLLIKQGLALRERPKPIIESDLDTKGGDTSSETVKEECSSIVRSRLSEEKVIASENEKQTHEEEKLNDGSETSIKIHKNLKDSKNSKAKGQPKARFHRVKQSKVESPKIVEDSFQTASSGGEWLSATSSDDDRASTKNRSRRRPKSTSCIEAEKNYPNLKTISASAASSPHHTLKELDASNLNTSVERNKRRNLSESSVIDWNDLIAEDESPNTEPVASVPTVASAPTPTTSTYSEASDWLPARPFEKNDFFAYSTFVDERACIYLHDAKLEPVLKALEEKMKSVFDEIPPEPVGSIWVPGQLCTVKYFINESWYRGKVLSVSEESIRVLMIDYGNEEECKHEDLRFKVMYLDVPAFANKVCLYQVFPKKGSKWLTSDLDELHKQIVENKIFVILKGKVRPGVATPAIIKLDEINVNHFMLENSNNLVSKKQIEQYEIESDDVIVEEEDSDVVVEEEHSTDVIEHQPASASNSSNTSLEQPTSEVRSRPVIIRQISLPHAKYCHNPLPKILEGQKLSVTVISILNYNKFIFEILTDQNIVETKEQFITISENIKEIAHKQPQLTDLEVGQACVTKYSEDGEWYRGEVINFDDDSSTVGIWFVDFGNFETVPKDTVRAIHPDWLMLPVVQYIGEVDDIELADESYLSAVFDSMTEYCGTVKLAEILSSEPLRVRLYDANNALAYRDLIELNLLVLKN